MACPDSGRSGGVSSVAFSPDGQTLGTSDRNGLTYICIWDPLTPKRTAVLPDLDSSGASAVAFSPAGKTLAVGDSNGSTYLWN
jgi:WD40 repeat protein